VLGNLHLPQDIEATRKIILASLETIWWFDFRGSNVHYTGSQDPNHGWINSYGQQWWDANPSNGTGITGRPHLMMFNVQQGSITRLKSRKPIAWNVQVRGSDIDISDSIVDAVSDKWESFPFNTDAFDVGASNVRITNLVAYNGDDAVAVNDGAHNLYVSDSTIGYQTHGELQSQWSCLCL
jgi:polygalacturonase